MGNRKKKNQWYSPNCLHSLAEERSRELPSHPLAEIVDMQLHRMPILHIATKIRSVREEHEQNSREAASQIHEEQKQKPSSTSAILFVRALPPKQLNKAALMRPEHDTNISPDGRAQKEGQSKQ
jgi:hypothetical protein